MHSVWIIGGAFALFALWMFEVDGRWIAAGAVAWLGLAFNSVIHAKNAAETALSSVGVMLKKRFDLIPGLVDTVQRYAEHESELLAEVVRLRARAENLPPAQAAALDNQVSRAVSQILATAESYPELKASANFQQLQRALNEVEEQISAARRTYNMAAKLYNDAVRMFPTNLLAAALGYREREYFEVPAGQEAPVDVMARFRSHERR
jgi:LemA protein